MSDSQPVRSLVVRPKTFHFSARPGQPGEAELESLLQAQRDTQPHEIRSPQDLQLTVEGRIKRNYRITSFALSQICGVVAPGLSQTIMSVAGMQRRQRRFGNDEPYSVKHAVEILNHLIRFRFSLFHNKGLIIDERARIVEGVVGIHYRLLSNYELFRKIKSRAEGRLEFYEASMRGRRLSLRYRRRDMAFAIDTPHSQREPFFGGWYFANSELGDSFVRGAAVLIRKWSQTSCLVPGTRQMRIVHRQGDRFDQKLERIFDLVDRRSRQLHECQGQMAALKSISLGFDDTRDRYADQIDRLEKQLRRWKIHRLVAREVIPRLLLYGSYKTDRMECPDSDYLEVPGADPTVLGCASRRTAYDLYNAICASAQQGSPEHREHAEEVAYRFLQNPTSFE